MKGSVVPTTSWWEDFSTVHPGLKWWEAAVRRINPVVLGMTLKTGLKNWENPLAALPAAFGS